MIDYSQIRLLALKEGVEDNKVSIGIWAKLKGYKKKLKSVDNKKILLYSLPD